MITILHPTNSETPKCQETGTNLRWRKTGLRPGGGRGGIGLGQMSGTEATKREEKECVWEEA